MTQMKKKPQMTQITLEGKIRLDDRNGGLFTDPKPCELVVKGPLLNTSLRDRCA